MGTCEHERKIAKRMSDDLLVFRELYYAEIEVRKLSEALDTVENFLEWGLYGKKADEIRRINKNAVELLQNTARQLASLLDSPKWEADNAE